MTFLLGGGLAPRVIGLDHQTQALFDGCFMEWQARRPRNALRKSYVDSKQAHKHLGISIPPAMQDIEVAVGLPETAVDKLAQRCMWDGVVAPNSSEDPFELEEVLDDNRFDIEFPQTVASQLTYSTAFQSASLGDVTAGEPQVKIMSHSALWSGAVWDSVRRQLRGFLAINSVDKLGRATSVTLFTAFEYIHCVQGAESTWYVSDVRRHGLKRVPVESLPFKPTLERPFGQSRVNRRVMNLTDRAVRTILRLEVHSEMFSAPKFLLMGADDSAFMGPDGNPIPLWTWYMTRLNAIPKPEGDDAEMPTLEQISQQSPQPHNDQLRMIYAQFSGETSVPLNSLGIVQDNPPSAEGLYAMKEDLVIAASNNNRVLTYGLNRTMQNAVMLRDGLTDMPQELRRISQKFRNPAMPSVVSQSDAMVKQIAAIPELAQTDVALEELGYTSEQIQRIRGDIRRQRASTQMSVLVEKFENGAVVSSGGE
ncbi:phage portal protein [Timonella sp. A28]|uniref:phage portal protein n=1 Tax=Timonella sp. A28 TaxID=3442640 RepID=UPI003EBBF68F